MPVTPFDQIKKTISKNIPLKLIRFLPDKWERLGDILILKLDSNLSQHTDIIAKTYAKALNCRSILQELEGITGTYREPNVKVIYGSSETETIHIENKIRYKLDPQRIMFSSGNMAERIRMTKISNKDETVIDLFAGIGYFTLPIAVYCKPKKIFSCEINSTSYEYLCENIVLNDVTSIVEPLLGDNRKTAPQNVADRVIMGYINDNHRFLPTAINSLKNKIGIIHYHDVSPNELLPNKPLNIVKEITGKYNRNIKLLKYKKIKSYAPGVYHVVLDIEVGE